MRTAMPSEADTRLIRSEWVAAVVGTLQCATGVIALMKPGDARDAVITSVTSLPKASSVLERHILRGFILDFIVRSSLMLSRRSCSAKEPSPVRPIDLIAAVAASTDPLDGALRWIDSFWMSLPRQHEPALGLRVAEVIRKEPARRWPIHELATRVGATPKAVRADFRRLFRCTPKDYQALLRIVDALPRVSCEKIDGLATSLGYKSKKDFYTSFKRYVGMPPGQYRRLHPSVACHIHSSLDAKLKR
jgi:AraC-like DNA-binding protein